MKQAKKRFLASALLSVISVLYLWPIFMVLLNSFKKKAYINRYPFSLPSEESFVALRNYAEGIRKTGFWEAAGNSVLITVGSVAVILLCTSMCAWYVSRRQSLLTRIFYRACLFSMVVPFQMVMFTLSKISDILKLNSPVGLIFVYLGFGAGLAVFLFCGFLESIPREVEEAAMIDGADPIRMFFRIILPMLKPTCISVGILETMWIWNDYLLPYLTLNLKKYQTIPIAIQYLKGGYGSIDWGAMMAMLVLAILPVVVFYLFCQRYIIEGVAAGAVKG